MIWFRFAGQQMGSDSSMLSNPGVFFYFLIYFVIQLWLKQEKIMIKLVAVFVCKSVWFLCKLKGYILTFFSSVQVSAPQVDCVRLSGVSSGEPPAGETLHYRKRRTQELH